MSNNAVKVEMAADVSFTVKVLKEDIKNNGDIKDEVYCEFEECLRKALKKSVFRQPKVYISRVLYKSASRPLLK